MNCQVETITPERAKELLQGNTDNRKLDKAKVKQWAAEMTAGRWQLTHQGVAVADDGTIVDGQHRLHAVIESGVTIETHVFYGAERTTFSVLDIGKTRSSNDIWSLAGHGSPNVGAIARVVYLYFNHRQESEWEKPNKLATSDTVLQWALAHGHCEVIKKAAHHEQKFRSQIKGVGSAIGASLAIMEIETGLRVEGVWEKVYQRQLDMIGLEAGEPVYLLSQIINRRDTAQATREGNPFQTKNRRGMNVTRTRLSILLKVIVDQLNGERRQQYRMSDGQQIHRPNTQLKSLEVYAA